jgi:hypothetical protein
VNLGTLFIILIAMSVVGLWLHFDRLHRVVMVVARAKCDELDIQLLDQTVVLRGFRLRRGTSQGFLLVTRYSFEFSSTGERRYQGVMEFAGRKMIFCEIDPHIVH